MKFKSQIKIFLALIAIAAIISSCEYEWVEPATVSIPDNVSFANDIIPVFDAGCNVGVCHGAGGIPPDLTASNAYDDLIATNMINTSDPASSILYTKMAPGGSMAMYSTPSSTALVLRWIEQGAENN